MTATEEVPEVGDYLKDSPKNWGKWGPDDEVGSLNYLTPASIVSVDMCPWGVSPNGSISSPGPAKEGRIQ